MQVLSIELSLDPVEAFKTLKRSMSAEVVYSDVKEVTGGFTSCILVFEKYYMRNSSRASLTVTIHNFDGHTKVTAIPSGGSQGMFLNFDWGAGDQFAGSVIQIFKPWLIGGL